MVQIRLSNNQVLTWLSCVWVGASNSALQSLHSALDLSLRSSRHQSVEVLRALASSSDRATIDQTCLSLRFLGLLVVEPSVIS
jgi:hypothetical protein